MPGPWQIFHVSPFLPLCPLPPLVFHFCHRITRKKESSAASSPSSIWTLYRYLHLSKPPSFPPDMEAGGRRRDLTSLLSDTRRKREVYYIHGMATPSYMCTFCSASLSQPISRTYEWRKKANKYVCYIGIRSVGATVAEGETFPPDFEKKGISTIVLRRNYKRRSFFYSHYHHHHSFGMLWFFFLFQSPAPLHVSTLLDARAFNDSRGDRNTFLFHQVRKNGLKSFKKLFKRKNYISHCTP